jgi:hypothetical protein
VSRRHCCYPLYSLLPSSSLHKQGAINGTKVPLLSTPEQETADKFEAPCHCCVSSGQPTAPRHYCPGSHHCHCHASKGQPTKVIDVVINKHRHGHRLCKIVALAPVVVLAATMTMSPINGCCQCMIATRTTRPLATALTRVFFQAALSLLSAAPLSASALSLLASSLWTGAFDATKMTLDVPASALLMDAPVDEWIGHRNVLIKEI